MIMSKRTYDDDDGRVIADMSGIERRSLFAANPSVFENKKKTQKRQPLNIESELSVWQMTWLALRLILPLIFAFLGAVALFLLFCQFVWLR